MTEPFSYSTTYILDKSHFSETYDESRTEVDAKKLYLKAIALALLGLAILYLTDISPYIAWFIIALGWRGSFECTFSKALVAGQANDQ